MIFNNSVLSLLARRRLSPIARPQFNLLARARALLAPPESGEITTGLSRFISLKYLAKIGIAYKWSTGILKNP